MLFWHFRALSSSNLVCFARHMAHNTTKLRFYVFLSFFDAFAYKVAQTWFVLHETWYRTLFGIFYCFEVVRIENNSHMLEITCQVAILCVLKLFWHFRTLSISNLVCFIRNLAHSTIWYIIL